ncbi:hypothetical protein F5Y12DRAFT_29206 [Xylaria sp. FL1777]|nr:hypothetical protein F5Y12DRAFT_29206 [Xylaria sp. FL1777]
MPSLSLSISLLWFFLTVPAAAQALTLLYSFPRYIWSWSQWESMVPRYLASINPPWTSASTLIDTRAVTAAYWQNSAWWITWQHELVGWQLRPPNKHSAFSLAHLNFQNHNNLRFAPAPFQSGLTAFSSL